MSELKITIPARSSDNFGEPLDFIFDTIYKINTSAEDSIRFDFSSCKFLSPFIFGGLVGIIQNQIKAGRKVLFTYNDLNEDLRNYLKTICFPNGFNYASHPLNKLDKAFEVYHSKNYIPIACFPAIQRETESKVREKIISAINSIFKKQLKLDGKILQAIYYLVDELTQNIADHSGSDSGILFAQFYPAKAYMDICIADSGKGLLQSYIDTGKHNPKTDEEAINFAIYGKSTKEASPGSRGFGLSTSRKMLVNGLNGKFFIYSGTAFFTQNLEKKELISLSKEYKYQGCFVVLRVPILNNEQFDFYMFVE